MRFVRIVVALVLATTLGAQQPASAEPGLGWRAAWSAAPQRPGANFTPNWSEQGFAGQTLRQVVRTTVPGAAVRIRLTNVYGTAPLTVSAATVARSSGGAAVKTGSLRRLTSGHAASFTIPAGAELVSGPVALPVSALERLTVTLHFAEYIERPRKIHGYRTPAEIYAEILNSGDALIL
ncbi:hypothetical protein ABZV14_43435 [Streptosporangium canum]|uniref:hypothetical protein n=1 Tax=Streptosporangium canum TaxID=324952 RepID=UPI0033BEB23C